MERQYIAFHTAKPAAIMAIVILLVVVGIGAGILYQFHPLPVWLVAYLVLAFTGAKCSRIDRKAMGRE